MKIVPRVFIHLICLFFLRNLEIFTQKIAFMGAISETNVINQWHLCLMSLNNIVGAHASYKYPKQREPKVFQQPKTNILIKNLSAPSNLWQKITIRCAASKIPKADTANLFQLRCHFVMIRKISSLAKNHAE